MWSAGGGGQALRKECVVVQIDGLVAVVVADAEFVWPLVDEFAEDAGVAVEVGFVEVVGTGGRARMGSTIARRTSPAAARRSVLRRPRHQLTTHVLRIVTDLQSSGVLTEPKASPTHLCGTLEIEVHEDIRA